MHLTYKVENDKFGDAWLYFESSLEKEDGEFEDGNHVSQWYQIEAEDSEHLDLLEGDGHGHGHDHDSDDHDSDDHDTGDGDESHEKYVPGGDGS